MRGDAVEFARSQSRVIASHVFWLMADDALAGDIVKACDDAAEAVIANVLERERWEL